MMCKQNLFWLALGLHSELESVGSVHSGEMEDLGVGNTGLDGDPAVGQGQPNLV